MTRVIATMRNGGAVAWIGTGDTRERVTLRPPSCWGYVRVDDSEARQPRYPQVCTGGRSMGATIMWPAKGTDTERATRVAKELGAPRLLKPAEYERLRDEWIAKAAAQQRRIVDERQADDDKVRRGEMTEEEADRRDAARSYC